MAQQTSSAVRYKTYSFLIALFCLTSCANAIANLDFPLRALEARRIGSPSLTVKGVFNALSTPTSTAKVSSLTKKSTTSSKSSAVAAPTPRWFDKGCFVVDNGLGDLLNRNIGWFTVSWTLTTKSCLSQCRSLNYTSGALLFGAFCACGDGFYNISKFASSYTTSTGCVSRCLGNRKEFCGGSDAVELYEWMTPSPTVSVPKPTWVPRGCFIDSPSKPLLIQSRVDAGLTVESCQNYCRTHQFNITGLEQGNQCWCGDTLTVTPSQTAPDTNCYTPCVGSITEICGGYQRLWAYEWKVPTLPTPTPTSTSTSPTATSVWAYKGCYADNPAGSMLFDRYSTSRTLTVEGCELDCTRHNFTYAAVESGNRCYCGNTMANHVPVPEASCATSCGGSATEVCGGTNFLNLYHYQLPIAQAGFFIKGTGANQDNNFVQTSPTVGGWSYGTWQADQTKATQFFLSTNGTISYTGQSNQPMVAYVLDTVNPSQVKFGTPSYIASCYDCFPIAFSIGAGNTLRGQAVDFMTCTVDQDEPWFVSVPNNALRPTTRTENQAKNCQPLVLLALSSSDGM